MASFSSPGVPMRGVPDARPESPQRITVYGLFRRHLPFLAGLPGEKSQFYQSDFGCEWRCEFYIGTCPPASGRTNSGNALQLHFSLIDIERQARPVAVLYLVEQAMEEPGQDRLLLPLDDLAATHELLNENLVGRGATIEAFENANHFIAALTKVRVSLGDEVTT